jgi:hypothetical protein
MPLCREFTGGPSGTESDGRGLGMRSWGVEGMTHRTDEVVVEPVADAGGGSGGAGGVPGMSGGRMEGVVGSSEEGLSMVMVGIL